VPAASLPNKLWLLLLLRATSAAAAAAAAVLASSLLLLFVVLLLLLGGTGAASLVKGPVSITLFPTVLGALCLYSVSAILSAHVAIVQDYQ
jgi:hypothetical protein